MWSKGAGSWYRWVESVFVGMGWIARAGIVGWRGCLWDRMGWMEWDAYGWGS